MNMGMLIFQHPSDVNNPFIIIIIAMIMIMIMVVIMIIINRYIT